MPGDGALDRLEVAQADRPRKALSPRPPEPPNRYERKRPGELIHVDVKKLGRFERPGHRITGRKQSPTAPTQRPRPRVVGWEFVTSASTTPPASPMSRCSPTSAARLPPAFFAEPLTGLPRWAITVERVMTDNGSPYVSKVHGAACRELGLSTFAPSPIGLGPTAKPNASFRRSRTAGPTERSTAPQPSAGQRSLAGSPTTTSPDDMAPSATSRPQLGSPSWNNVLSSYT